MNAWNSETLETKSLKFGDNMFDDCVQLKNVSVCGHRLLK